MSANYSGKFISVVDGDLDKDDGYWPASTGVHNDEDTALRQRVYYSDMEWISKTEYELVSIKNHELEKRRTGRMSPATLYRVDEA